MNDNQHLRTGRDVFTHVNMRLTSRGARSPHPRVTMTAYVARQTRNEELEPMFVRVAAAVM